MDRSKRSLAIVDIENYCGKSCLNQADVARAKGDITTCVGNGMSNLFIVGTSHSSNFLNAKFAWPEAQHVFMAGRNGADLALISAARLHLPNICTFNKVYLLSGDGIFVRLTKELHEAGAETYVVSLRRQFNRCLTTFASGVTLLDTEESQAKAS